VLDGSALVAWRQSVERKAPFTQMFVADAHPALCDAATKRLRAAGAPVHAETGLASATVDRVVPLLDPFALHFAFLDPFNLAALPFEVIRKVATLKRMDILIHVSAQDINRNLRRYIKNPSSPLDFFAPGWRDHADTGRPDFYVRARIVEHWRGLLKSAGMDTAEAAELVSGPNNQPLYWLAFASSAQLADADKHLDADRAGPCSDLRPDGSHRQFPRRVRDDRCLQRLNCSGRGWKLLDCSRRCAVRGGIVRLVH